MSSKFSCSLKGSVRMADLISHRKSPLYHQFIVRSGMRIRILSHQRPRSNIRICHHVGNIHYSLRCLCDFFMFFFNCVVIDDCNSLLQVKKMKSSVSSIPPLAIRPFFLPGNVTCALSCRFL